MFVNLQVSSIIDNSRNNSKIIVRNVDLSQKMDLRTLLEFVAMTVDIKLHLFFTPMNFLLYSYQLSD